MTSIRAIPLLLGASLLLASVGCSKFDLRKGIPWMPGENGELERPMKIIAVWTDTILSQGEETPARGFGGRLMFYSRDDSKPVKVEGSLVVYAFDETNRDPRNVRPERKYVFSEEEFARHHSEGKMGHSYSVWLPWDRIGGPQAEISLMARFTPKEGGMIAGEQQTVLLPGVAVVAKGSQTTNQPPAPAPTIQQATYVATPSESALRSGMAARHEEAMGQRPESRQMTTTTIPVSAGPGNRFPVATGSPFVGMPVPQAAPTAAAGQQSSSQETVAWAQPAVTAGQSSAHFGPGRHRPLGAPIARLDRDRGPWRPTHAGPPSAAGTSHQSGSAP
jgi:hypothetical protein